VFSYEVRGDRNSHRAALCDPDATALSKRDTVSRALDLPIFAQYFDDLKPIDGPSSQRPSGLSSADSLP